MDVRTAVRSALRGLPQVTIGDVTQVTGLPAPAVAAALWGLVVELHGFVDVAAGGDVLFRFPRHFDPSRGERWQAFWRAAFSVLKVAYRIGLMIVLVLYFVVFLLITIFVIIAAMTEGGSSSSSSSSSSSWGSSSSSSGGSVDWLGWFSFGSSSAQPQSSSSFDRWDRSRSMSSYEGTSGRGMAEKISAFVFGEEEPRRDPRDADRQAIAFARQHQGVITATDIVALSGGTIAEAARDGAHLAFENNGGAAMTDKGGFLYEMPDLVVSATAPPEKESYWDKVTGANSVPKVPFYWEHREPELPFSDNSIAFNIGISCVNAFNLFWAAWLTVDPGFLVSLGAGSRTLWEILGPVALIFSALFFIIPAIRVFWLRRENRRRQVRNQFRDTLARLFELHVTAPNPLPLTAAMLAGEGGRSDLWQARLEQLASLYKGRLVDGGGYVFDRMRQDMADAAAARLGQATIRTRLGAIVQSTEDAPRISA